VIAADGTVLERLQARPTNLPEIGELTTSPSVGERPEVTAEILRVAASMGEPLRRQIASVRLEGEDVIAALRDGGTVLYGPATELVAKNRALAEMLRWTRAEVIGVRTIDVRVPTAPSLEPIGRHANLPPNLPPSPLT
jgi:hypothetical protein